MTTELFDLHQGSAPLLISIPHLGRHLPEEILGAFSPEAEIVSDTDWHLDQLYGFARELGASILGARVSRYAIDLNRPPSGESLYPGQTTTGLCPTETFAGVSLYRPGQEPKPAEIERRRETYWQPYHDALQAELQRMRTAHGKVLLWEAHSISSVLPRLFEGKLPDLNFGTNSGAACDPGVLQAVLAPLALREAASAQTSPYTHVVDGRFKGGYITRHYGRTADGVNAIQMEMCQSIYMNETYPFAYRPDLASGVQRLLRPMLERGLAAVRTLA